MTGPAADLAPAVVLADPQLGENIGAAARAMANFGLSDLRLVRPRDGWPNPRAYAVASGANWILDAVRVFDTTEAALTGLGLVFATTARDREMAKEVVTPEEAVARMRALPEGAARAGLLFGSERVGLVNDDIALADAILTIPTDARFSSLNLAQSLIVIAYEWQKAHGSVPPSRYDPGHYGPARKDELIGFFEHIERELDEAGFLFPPEKRAAMVRNMRAIWHRAQLSEQDVRTLRGIVTALVHRPHVKRREKGRESEGGGDA